MKLLVTAVGKRVQLIKYLKRNFEIVGVDCSRLTAALHFVDKFHIIPRYDEKDYRQCMVEICSREKIEILIPLLEAEFSVLDSIRSELSSNGTFLMLSQKNELEICQDKWKSYEFFVRNAIDTPTSYLKVDEESAVYPLFIKPRTGMGSKDAYKINTVEELQYLRKQVVDPVIQEYIEGTEYTIDCLCGLSGEPVAVVPRERLEVRAGEVIKTRTILDWDLINGAVDICRKLGGIGPLTLQCIRTRNGNIKWIEINPRMGGGVPLTFEAGVDYGHMMKQMVLGEEIPSILGQFRELTMLRYDEAVFIDVAL